MSDIKPHADILIVTVTRVESRAVLSAFCEATGQNSMPVAIDDRIYHDLGTLNGAHVFLALSEMGAIGLGASQQAVQKGIAALRPAAIIMVGIAFGVSEAKQQIGDIQISQQLWLYDIVRSGKDAIVPRGDKPHASPRLINYLRSAELYWDKSTVRFGLILTGEKLIDNIDYRNQLHALTGEAIGGEMEGAGLYVTCQDAQVDWVLVKGICDWADGDKAHNKDEHQRLAADNAANFVVHALRQAPFKVQRPSMFPQPLATTLIQQPSQMPVAVGTAQREHSVAVDRNDTSNLVKEHVFLSYAPDCEADVAVLAQRLKNEMHLTFFFAPWNEHPGAPIQEQFESALRRSQSCAIFLRGEIPVGYQYEAMRIAIQTRIDDDQNFRVIPVFLSGPMKLNKRDLPSLLRRFTPVEFTNLNDEHAFRLLLAGILNMTPIEVEGFLETKKTRG